MATATVTADEEGPPPGMILLLPSHHLVPTTSVLYQQTSKAGFPYFMHPVLILPSVLSATNTIVTFLPIMPLYGEKLDQSRQAAYQSTSASPFLPSCWTSNSPSYIFLDQSWTADSTHIHTSPDTTLFPFAKIAPLSIRVASKLFILVDRAWSIESSCLTPYPPRQSWRARGKALPNPSMFLAPETLEWVVTLHFQKVAAATRNLRGAYGKNSYSTVLSGWASEEVTPETETETSEVTAPSELDERVEVKKRLGLNAAAEEFVPGIRVKVEEKHEAEQEQEPNALVPVSTMKEEEKLHITPDKGAEREELPPEPLRILVHEKVESMEENESLFEQWGCIADMLVDNLVTTKHPETLQLQDGEAMLEKGPIVAYRKRSRFFEAKLPLFNAGETTTKDEDQPVTVPEVAAVTMREDILSTTIVDERNIAQVDQSEEEKAPQQASDAWGDWSGVHAKWNIKAKMSKQVHWKDIAW